VSKAACRLDWHQTGNNVVVTVFAKCADPTKTQVKVNQVCVDIYVVFEDDKIFTECFELNRVSWLPRPTPHL